MNGELQQYMLGQLERLMGIDSTTSCCYEIEKYIKGEFESMGYAVQTFNRGGLLIDLGGEGEGIVLSAHADAIGLMVRRILPDGTLTVLPVGGVRPEYADLANVRVYTRAGAVYTGTVRRKSSCVHTIQPDAFKKSTLGGFDENLVVTLDKNVSTEADVTALGIRCGDIVAIDPNFAFADDGYKPLFGRQSLRRRADGHGQSGGRKTAETRPPHLGTHFGHRRNRHGRGVRAA